ncbi:hypothetical protein FHG64_15720 [Antarcticibacterium flavum]|uniref:Polyprenyl synthetase family protein n=1 Tax=Antarcticibacterium flavum TaxID=2058175 RepID=A0A5B7X7V1_9FLAO|nr:hypothetical protein [Antarcticibacterium flavum]QCY70723.1 hypothetical protein FHG64_15720 [Antarcticibacterium flavum]
MRVRKQKRFITSHLEKEIYPFRISNDGSLGEKEFKKLTAYYALGVPGVLGEALATLRGTPLSLRERLCLTYLGGISGLLDDLFDDPVKEASHLRDFVLHPEEMESQNSHEELLLNFYQKGLAFSSYPEKIKQQAEKVFEAQEKSLYQQELSITPGAIDEIICSKGGESFIFYRLCMEHPLEEAEANLLFKLGALMQLGNDIFDIWKDLQEGLTTAATRCRKIEELRTSFDQKLKEIYKLSEKTSYTQKNIQKFLRIITLGLARVYVCLDQFLELQESTPEKFFDANNYSRKQLICDMQKPGKQLTAIKYYLRLL